MKIRRKLVLAIAAVAATVAAQPAAAQGGKISGPTPIKDTENPARSAVHASCEIFWPVGGGGGVRACDLMTVPAETRLVIEFATFICSVQAGTAIFRTATVVTTLADSNPTVVNSRLLLTREESEPSWNFWVASHPLRAYSDAGSLVRGFAAFIGDPSSGPHCVVTISGYLVNVQ